MAIDMLVDSTELDNGLTTIADAIRAKGGTSALLAFPNGMAQAVEDIPTGITPSGKKLITDTSETDVTAFATAQVSSDTLIAENIKKNVNILGVVGSFEGGGGSLPSVISKISGGSFTLPNDTEVRSYSWSHNLGVIPRIVTVWCDDLTTVSPSSVAVVTDIQATVYDTEYTVGNSKSALINTIYRTAAGASSYNLTNVNLGQLSSFITASTIKLNVTQYYKAGTTYKWAAYA